jgi:hypothetical protein
MNYFLLLLIFLGFILIVVGYVNTQVTCGPRRVEYRYIPKTIMEEQESPDSITDIFAKMFFEDQSTFLRSPGALLQPPNIAQLNGINKFFISQA